MSARDPSRSITRAWVSPRTTLARAPPPFHTRARPLPERRNAPSGQRFHPLTLVPPLWFLTTSAACSALEAAGLLRPASGPEVHRVSSCAARPPVSGRGLRPILSRSAFHTLRRLPLVSSRTVSPRPLPSCPCSYLAATEAAWLLQTGAAKLCPKRRCSGSCEHEPPRRRRVPPERSSRSHAAPRRSSGSPLPDLPLPDTCREVVDFKALLH